MIENLPNWINLLFLITTFVTIVIFYFSNGKATLITFLIVAWAILHSVLAYNGFYQNTKTIPPRFALVLLPATIFIIIGLLPKAQKWFFQQRNTQISTFLHTVRLPVEIVLFELFVYQMIPELMTFEGRNFDILAGITAPIIGYLFLKKQISKKLLLIWNIIGLFLVLFILTNGILSAELPFQQFAFEQPNRGITYFPFILLPAVIVPIVVWTHLSDIIKLRKELKSNKK